MIISRYEFPVNSWSPVIKIYEISSGLLFLPLIRDPPNLQNPFNSSALKGITPDERIRIYKHYSFTGTNT